MPSERNYWNQSRSALYSFMFTLPLFLIYELGILLVSSEDVPNLRNGADVLMRQVLGTFGILGVYGFGVVFMLGFSVVFLLQKRNWAITNIRSKYLLIMFGESLIWGAGLFLILRSSQALLMFNDGKMLIQQLILAVGAGIYEEFIFRALLITGLSAVFNFVFQWSQPARGAAAVIAAAVIFSLFHFMGSFGDNYEFRLLVIRAVAGTGLGIIYILRGFGIAAFSHTIYDLIVLTLITTAPD